MTSSVNRSQLRVSSVTLGRVLLALIWLIQLIDGEPDPACKHLPDMMKSDTDEKCCHMPQVFLNATLQECWNGLEKTSKTPAEKSCEFSTCLFRRDNHMKPDGSLDAAQIRSYIVDSLEATAEWKGLLEKIVLEECLPMVENSASAIRTLTKPTMGDCESAPSFLIACAIAKIYTKCPASDWTESQPCNDWKSYFMKCSNSADELGEMFQQVESHKLADGQT